MTNTVQTTEAATRLAERLRGQTVESLKDTHPDAYRMGVTAAADSLDVDTLRKLDTFFIESLDGVAVHTLTEDEVWNGLVAAVGDAGTARDLLSESAGEPLSSPAELAAFVLGAVQTWSEAAELL